MVDTPTEQGSTEEVFSKRAYQSQYIHYLSTFARISGGSAFTPAPLAPAKIEELLAHAIAARDVKDNRLRSLAEYEAEVQSLKKTTIEPFDTGAVIGIAGDTHNW